MHLIAMLITFFKMKFWKFLSKFKPINIERSETEDAPKIPKALIERFTNLMSEYVELR